MAVVDSNTLILMSKIGRLSLLRYFKEVMITPEIYEEVVKEAEGKPGVSEIEKACDNWITITEAKSKEIGEISRLEGVEVADSSIILLARESDDLLLTNDRALIRVARSKGVECWWLTTFLLRLVKEKKIEEEDTTGILFDLIENGMRLKIEVYAAILREINEM